MTSTIMRPNLETEAVTNWAIIGTSGFARETCVPTLLQASSAQLLGCCGSTPGRGLESQARFSLAKAYDSVEDVCADPDVEAVWIASPTGLHAAQATTLMVAGKSVLIEKPLASTSIEAEQVKKMAEQTGSKAAVGFHQRFKTAHRRARELVDAGVLGDIAYVRCHFLAAYDEEPGEWRRSASSAGGGWAVNDIGTHLLDTVTFVSRSGVSEAKALFGHVRFAYETDDIFAGVLKLRSGAVASIEAATAVAAPTTRLEVIGTRGSLVVQGSFRDHSTLVLNGNLLEEHREDHAYVDQVEAFEMLLKGQSNDLATLENGIDNVVWVETMLNS